MGEAAGEAWEEEPAAEEEAVQRDAHEQSDEEETHEAAGNWMEGGAQSQDLTNATSRDESCAEDGAKDDGASLQDVRWTTVSAQRSEASAEATNNP